jgi:hypothetical protein
MLQVLNMDYIFWAKKFSLTVKEHECRNCKKSFLSTVPVADKGLRGLQIPDHGCPSEYNVSHFIFVDVEMQNALLKSISQF